MDKAQSLRDYIKYGAIIIYIATSAMSYLGLIIDGFKLGFPKEVIINNSIAFALVLISNILYFLKFLKLPLSFGIVVYSLILNITIGFCLIEYEKNEVYYFFRDSFFVVYLMILTYIIVNKTNGIIITIIYFLSYLQLTFSSQNPFLIESAFLFITIFLAFSGVSYFFVKTFEQAIYEQTVKSKIIEQQNKVVNDTNNILEERQKRITEQAEELTIQKKALAKRNDELNELIATKDKFFSIIAHDLKNPLNSLIGISELLYNEYSKFDNNMRDNLIKTIYKNSKNTYNLLENLLLWSRMQTGRIKEELKNIDIGSLFEEADALLINMRKQKRIVLTKNFVPETLVCADPFMLTSVIHNLLTNAIKFTPHEGRIHISTQTTGKKMLQVCITDTGVGIPEEEIPKLFKIDQSYSTVGTDEEKGTGLGLLLCKEFIERNRGSIWVESKLGQGSKFYFTLMIADN